MQHQPLQSDNSAGRDGGDAMFYRANRKNYYSQKFGTKYMKKIPIQGKNLKKYMNLSMSMVDGPNLKHNAQPL